MSKECAYVTMIVSFMKEVSVVFVCMHICTCAYMWVCGGPGVYTYMCVFVCACVCVCVSVCVCVCDNWGESVFVEFSAC